MAKKKSLSYRDAGVDIDIGNELAGTYVGMMESTFNRGVVRNDGGFGGLYNLKHAAKLFGKKMKEPVLVSGTDGVGTKLKVAFLMDKHDTVGIDLVAMSVNDVLVQGAEPLFFLDYIGTGKAEKRIMLDLVKGVAEGCRQSDCALLGGETAEMPGFYAEGEYDLAGFAVGIVEKSRLIDGKKIKPGNVLLGIPSSGLHSNGYSLARKALLEVGKLKLKDKVEELGCTLGEELLRPTRIYVKPLISLLKAEKKNPIKGLVHITGGGLIENVPRVLPKNCDACFMLGSWPELPVFDLIRKCGNVEPEEMYRVFNMGLGMVAVVGADEADKSLKLLKKSGCEAFVVGEIRKGKGVTRLVK